MGRAGELAELDAALSDVASGRGRLVLLAGEAGIGKTRLADEVSRRARDAGATVLWGRCWEGPGAPAFWPWVQILRTYAGHAGAASLVRQEGPGVAQLAQLVPELVPDSAELATQEAEHARFYLFDTISQLLAGAARPRPLVLVVDDLHLADEASLLLLHFVARSLRSLPVLLLGTYREHEAHRNPDIGPVLAAVTREGLQLSLHGLSRDDIERFITETAGTAPTASLSTAVHARTDGNPFFVEEVVRLLVADGRLHGDARPDGADLGIPGNVRAAIRRRLEPLDGQARGAILAAAVGGARFEVATLREVLDLSTDRVLTLLNHAVDAGIVMAVDDLGRFRFGHTLICDTLRADLPPARRAELHRRWGEALQARYGADQGPHLAELAHHFLRAGDMGATRKAVAYAEGAGHMAADQLSFELAAEHYAIALDAAESANLDDVRRCDLLLALGEAQSRAGDNRRARTTFQHAAAIARRREDPERLARAALGSGGSHVTPTAGIVDPVLVRQLQQAVAALPEADTALRARLLGRLAMERYYDADRSERDALSGEAVEIARRLGDRTVLAYCLNARHYAVWGIGDVNERITSATEILQVAEQAGATELALQGHMWRVVALLELGDMAGADAEIAIHRRLATSLRQPYFLWESRVFEATRAILDGRLDDADQLSRLALQLGESQQDPTRTTSFGPNALMAYGVQQVNIARERGQLGALEHEVRQYVAQYPTLPAWRCSLAALLAQEGRLDEAREIFDQLAAEGVDAIPQDGNWLASMTLLAETCATIGDRERAEVLHERLLPYAGRFVVGGQGYSARGAIAHYLGLLAAAMGRAELAVGHYEQALKLHERMGAVPYTARTRLDLADALLARRGDADADRARGLLYAARRAYTEMGSESFAERAARTLAGVSERRPPPTRASSTGLGTFRREGEYWTVGLDGQVVRLRDAKGMRHLATLLAQPGREVHALSLVGSRHPASLGDAGVTLDAHAQSAYRARLVDLSEELDEARRHNDPARVAALEDETDFIVRELAAGIGLGGRSRSSGSASERARVNVTRAIHAAVRKVADNHPVLGAHLQRTVRTGTYCCYEPDPRAPISWTR